MVNFSKIDTVLLDIEGTVSDVRFVYDVMFPFARQRMKSFLESQHRLPEVLAAIEQVARDANLEANHWSSDSKQHEIDIDKIDAHLQELMAMDSKATGLKALQGLVWKSGFETGQLRAELFPDVLPVLRLWSSIGKRLYIYSSGSVLAQQLFFRFTTEGDLSPLLSGYFDTVVGKKQESSSYHRIAEAIGTKPQTILFVSDIAEELIAASISGMQVVASVRPSNKPLNPSYLGGQIFAFSDISLVD
jgi:enolase-phosphatase E1